MGRLVASVLLPAAEVVGTAEASVYVQVMVRSLVVLSALVEARVRLAHLCLYKRVWVAIRACAAMVQEVQLRLVR